MKDYSSMLLCGECGAIYSFPDGVGQFPICSRCGSDDLDIRFIPKDGCLVVWDSKIEEFFEEDHFLRWLKGLIRRVL